jgi:hypothetical protein
MTLRISEKATLRRYCCDTRGIAEEAEKQILNSLIALLHQIHIENGELLRCCRVIVTDAKGSFLSVNDVFLMFLLARKFFAQMAQLIWSTANS